MSGNRYFALWFLLVSSVILMAMGFAFDSGIHVLFGGAFSSACLLLMASGSDEEWP